MTDVNPSAPKAFPMIAFEGWSDLDYLKLSLNDELEYAISEILRDGKIGPPNKPPLGEKMVQWGRAMAETIGGYQTWQQVADYVRACLTSGLEDPTDSKSRLVGDEQALIALLSTAQRSAYGIKSKLSLDVARKRLEVLSEFRTTNSVTLTDDRARLFRKIYYAYKLYEALNGQVGYYNGSLEFQANFTADFEYWMYLIQLQLRKPIRQHLYPAPKSMALYLTEDGSPLPWNNQFSFSYGFHEFGDEQIPVLTQSEIEKALVEAIADDGRWRKLLEVTGWREDKALQRERTLLITYRWGKLREASKRYSDTDLLNLKLIGDDVMALSELKQMPDRRLYLGRILADLGGDEIKKKAFYTLVLGMTWSDELLPLEHNLFRLMANDPTISQDVVQRVNGMLNGAAVKDPRLVLGDLPSVERLALAKRIPNVVGRNSNVLVTPESAIPAFRAKLLKLTTAQLADLYGNHVEQPRIDRIESQARDAAEAWMTRAITHRKPIFTGPSGHALTYLNLYIHCSTPKPVRNAPTLGEARMVLLAGLIGRNQHHSYDEAMTGSDGVKWNNDTLRYTDPQGYRDMLQVGGDYGPFIKQAVLSAAAAIARNAVKQATDGGGRRSWNPPEDFEKTVREWYQLLSGKELGQMSGPDERWWR